MENKNEVRAIDGAVDGENSTPKQAKTYRFKAIEKEQVDEIASKSCKKKTHKQIAWGVKIFRGNC